MKIKVVCHKRNGRFWAFARIMFASHEIESAGQPCETRPDAVNNALYVAAYSAGCHCQFVDPELLSCDSDYLRILSNAYARQIRRQAIRRRTGGKK